MNLRCYIHGDGKGAVQTGGRSANETSGDGRASREGGLPRGDGGGVEAGVVYGPPPEQHPLEYIFGRQAGLQGVKDGSEHGHPGSLIRGAVTHANLSTPGTRLIHALSFLDV